VSAADTGAGPGRFAEVDALKGVGILLVVLIHSLRPSWDPGISGAELWLGFITRFAVPGFFAASGYLYATDQPIAGAIVGRRLLRLFVPYAVASLAAQVFFLVSSVPPQTGPLWRDLLLAASFGAYYFVLILAVFIVCSPLLARMGSRSVAILLIPLLIAQWLLETGTVPSASFFWHLRNPFLWAGYFVLGWWVRLHREAIVGALARNRRQWVGGTLVAWLLLATSLAFSSAMTRMVISSTAWLTIFVSVALVFVVSAGRDLPAALRPALGWLSDASYPLYLFHLFFLSLVAPEMSMDRGQFEAGKLLAVWGCGVVGPIALLGLGRKLLGSRSRLLFGA
jgi:peptidoglycan/LPS O-acetylase OafA/YrhL